MDLFWHLGTEDFFTGLEDERGAFLALARRRELKKDDPVFAEGEPGRSCYYLERGLVRIFSQSRRGREPIFFLRRSGEIFGLAEVLDCQPRRAAAQALLPGVLHEVDKAGLESFLAGHPRAAQKIIRTLGRRLRHLSEQVEGLASCDVDTRMARLLLTLSADAFAASAAPAGPVEVPLRLTQEQMASMTGSCQQTVCQFLKKFQDEGLIGMRGRTILLLDPAALVERAGG
jgi:cAMP-binding proteins - catabolite gene activator and regulatory subunit of cAMP-dependent protein kinases